MFASQIRGRIMQIRIQLANLKKKDMSMAASFQKMKGLADQIASAGRPMHEEDIVPYIFTGLGPDYDSVVSSVSTSSDPMGLNELYAHLIYYELRIEQNKGGQQISLSADNVMHQDNRGGGSRQFQKQARGQGRTFGGRFHHNGGPHPTCQVYGKVGHDALRCYHRFDHSYHHEDQNRPASAAATTSYKVDQNWYVDTGATDHLTSDLDHLSIKERYRGGDQVQVANGSGSCNDEGASAQQVQGRHVPSSSPAAIILFYSQALQRTMA